MSCGGQPTGEDQRLLNTTSIVAILSGGKSRRMGRDKAMIHTDPDADSESGPAGQQTWLEKLCELAVSSGANVLVVGRERPNGWCIPNIHFFPDDAPSIGPLGGLATALRHANAPVMLVGCDMPRLTEQAFRWLAAQQAQLVHSDGVALVAGKHIEPLFSIYSPSLLPTIHGQMQRGEYSLRGLMHSARFAMLDAPDWLLPQLAGVNTPQELQAWRAEQS